MDEVMALALRAMQQDVARVERVGVNLANALTPGYKREMLVQRADAADFSATFEQQALQARAGGADATQSPVFRDFRPGTLKATGEGPDVALAGPGFFEIATASGPAYTRLGQFHVDAAGRLVTAGGEPVMGQGGELSLVPGPFAIDKAGQVSQAGRTLGQLKVVDFGTAGELQPIGAGRFVSDATPALLEARDTEVRQGFLENSNVDSTREIVDLMQTMRHFESLHRAVQSYDDMLGTAVRKLGEI